MASISTKKIKLKKFVSKAIFILLTLQGLRGLYLTVRDIFFVYPKIALYYQELSFDQSVLNQLIQKAALVAITSFIETAYGLSMVIKKSSAINKIHTVIGFLVLIASLYLKREGALPDFEMIEKLAYLLW